MRNNRFLGIVLVLGFASSVILMNSAQAGTHDPKINAHQANQHARIKQGVQSGELTKGEAARLAAQQRHIRKTELKYKSDGELTQAERMRLKNMSNNANKTIYSQKHDEQAHKD